MSARLGVLDLGRRPYLEALELQRALCRQRMAGELLEDLLVLVEHEPVVTLGRGTRASSLPLPAAELARRGVEAVEVERGGDVTYHGPGQLVGYPILQLREHREDVHWYLRQLEAALVAALDALGVTAERNPGLTGVWTGGRKIASIGIHVKQWVTLHGFALNVSTDLRGFDLIVPCGIDGVVMTSVAAELGRTDAERLWGETRRAVVEAFARTFAFAQVGEAEGAVIPSPFAALRVNSASDRPRHASEAQGSHVPATRSLAALGMTPPRGTTGEPDR